MTWLSGSSGAGMSDLERSSPIDDDICDWIVVGVSRPYLTSLWSYLFIDDIMFYYKIKEQHA